jgi:hypothetical protein
MDEHNEENRFECGLCGIYNIYPKIKSSSKSCKSRRIEATKITHVKPMKRKIAAPRSRD